MKILQHRIPALLLLVGMGLASTAEAGLIARLGGLAVYDTDFNITWLANANANGLMTWAQANAWAAGLNIDGVTGWRLPTALNADSSGPDLGYNVIGSELGHLFYNELGGVAGQSITTTHNANYNLFTNIQSAVYWSGTGYAPGPNVAWVFSTINGDQVYAGLVDSRTYSWAVRSGDVAAVPEPGVMGLFGVGALALVGVRRRRG
jgi:hypothetical protein